MLYYVHVAEAHAREWPEAFHQAARGEIEPDRRIIAMLGARGKAVAKTTSQVDRSAAFTAA